METAKVFMSGKSQAVRIPKKYRFMTDTVTIQQVGDGILLTPVKRDITLEEFFASHTQPDFELDREAAQQSQEREFFK